MVELNLDLPDAALALIEARVGAGEYASASDYLSDLILRDRQRSAEDAKWLEELDVSLARGIADADAGRLIDADVVFNELERKYTAMIEAEENGSAKADAV